MRKMGLEPTRHCCHKILSLARLPVPTLPHLLSSFLDDSYSIASVTKDVNKNLKKIFRKKFKKVLDERRKVL